MTQGFYEQLHVDPTASPREIRTAYTRVVAQLLKRRKAVLERGGDPSPLELARGQAEEAWRVLSDPVRRRRYDAMRAVALDGFSADGAELWRRVAGALVHPAASAAAELLRVSTNLKVGALPPAPRSDRKYTHDDEITVIATTPKRRPEPVPFQRADGGESTANLRRPEVSEPKVVSLPSRGSAPEPVSLHATPEPALRVVDGSRASAPVVMMPSRKKPVSSEDIAQMVDKNGYSGALLKAVREARGLTLQEMSDTTRISVKYLEAIEGDHFDHLPSATFVRGYVREMSRLLELDDESVVAGYMRRLR